MQSWRETIVDAVFSDSQASSGGNRGGETQSTQVDLTETVAAEFEPVSLGSNRLADDAGLTASCRAVLVTKTVAMHAGVPTRFKKQNVDQLQAFGLPRRIAQEASLPRD